MDLGFLGSIQFTPQFLAAILQITLIDLVLAGDNAVVIALAVQNLHGRQRKLGIIAGAGGAVVLRVIATSLTRLIYRVRAWTIRGQTAMVIFVLTDDWSSSPSSFRFSVT